MAPVVAPSLPSPIEGLPNPLSILSHRTPPIPNFFFRPPLQKYSQPPLSPRLFDPTSRAINGAYATFISKDDYLPGALVLAYCHHKTKSNYPFIILATPTLSQNARAIIKKVGIKLIDIEPLVPAREQYDPSVTDTRFRETWTKLRVFEQTQYERIVMMDSDMIICKNMDELFTLPLGEDEIAATYVCACNPRRIPHYPSDWTPSNCAYTSLAYPACLNHGQAINTRGPRPHSLLNSGLVVLHPSVATFGKIKAFLDTSPLVRTFIFPDQDLLAAFFQGKWKALPFIYNALKTLRDIHTDIWQNDFDIKCLHYILEDKPWKVPRNLQGTSPDGGRDITNQWWWDRYDGLLKKMWLFGMDGELRYLGTLVTSRV